MTAILFCSHLLFMTIFLYIFCVCVFVVVKSFLNSLHVKCFLFSHLFGFLFRTTDFSSNKTAQEKMKFYVKISMEIMYFAINVKIVAKMLTKH